MSNSLPGRWKYEVMFGLLVLAVVGLGVRMAMLIRDDRAKALKFAQIQERMHVPVPGRPGSIVASTGNRVPVVLAGSKQVPSCAVDPKFVREDEMGDVSIRAGKALGLDPLEVQNLLYMRRDSQFVWLKHNISPAQLKAIQEANLRGIRIEQEWQRDYPNADLAASVLGWRRPDGKPGGGLEQSQDKVLAAKEGLNVMVGDAARHPFEPVPNETILPVDGNNVYLTIDTTIQQFVQEAVTASVDKFKAKWGVGIVLNPQTGEILAMSSVYMDPKTKRPAVFDPNSFNASSPEARTNYAITVPFEPGSAAKTIFATAFVNEGLVDWETRINCEGGVWHAPKGGTISDHGKSYGVLPVWDVVAQSSNIGMGKMGLMAGNDILYRIATDFGLGQKTAIELPGESRGIIRQRRLWDTYSTPRVPFGQEISTTALQLAMAYCALANGGELLRPRMIDRITDVEGKTIYHSQRQVVRRVIRPEVSKGAIAAMQQVVEVGTGREHARSARWTTFGKTGTAQIPSNVRGHPGYVDGAFTATFVGGAPVDNPRIICLVSIHWPDRSIGHYGSTVAAPYFKQIVEKTMAYLNVPPDKEELETTVAVKTGGAGPVRSLGD